METCVIIIFINYNLFNSKISLTMPTTRGGAASMAASKKQETKNENYNLQMNEISKLPTARTMYEENFQSSPEKVTKLRSIANFNWGNDDMKYNNVVNYVKNKKFMPAIYDQSKKSRYNFRVFGNKFSLDNNENLYVENLDIDKNLKSKLVFSDSNIRYTIVRPSKKIDEIYKVVSGGEMQETSLSTTYIYNRLVNNKRILGISQDYIKQYLKSRESTIAAMRKRDKKSAIKSYRPRYPRQHWQMDTVHMQHKDMQKQNDFKYFLLIIDIFTKYTYIRPMKVQTPDIVASHLEDIFLSGDIPSILQSDNGSEFKSAVSILCNKYKVQQRYTPSYSPQTNGFAENRNKLVKSYIYLHLVHVNKNRDESTKAIFVWVDAIPKIQFAINSIKHSVTKMTPIQIHFGIHTHAPIIQDEYLQQAQHQRISPPKTFSDLKFDNDEVKRDKEQFEKYDTNQDNDISNKNELIWYKDELNKTSKERTKFVKQNISREADKRETRIAEKMKHLRQHLKPGIFVKVLSNIRASSCTIQSIHLRYKITIKNGDQIIKQFHSNKLPGGFGVDKDEATEVPKVKWKEKLYSQIFIIGESRTTPSGSISYILYKYNTDIGKTMKTHVVERQVSRLRSQWIKHFYAEHIVPIEAMEVHGMVRNNARELEMNLEKQRKQEFNKALKNFEEANITKLALAPKIKRSVVPGFVDEGIDDDLKFVRLIMEVGRIQICEYKDSGKDKYLLLKFRIRKKDQWKTFHDINKIDRNITALQKLSKMEQLDVDKVLRNSGYLREGQMSHLGRLCNYDYLSNKKNEKTDEKIEVTQKLLSMITTFHYKSFDDSRETEIDVPKPYLMSFLYKRKLVNVKQQKMIGLYCDESSLNLIDFAESDRKSFKLVSPFQDAKVAINALHGAESDLKTAKKYFASKMIEIVDYNTRKDKIKNGELIKRRGTLQKTNEKKEDNLFHVFYDDKSKSQPITFTGTNYTYNPTKLYEWYFLNEQDIVKKYNDEKDEW